MNDYEGCHVLCEDCHAALTPQERLVYYEALLALWQRARVSEMDRRCREVREAVLNGG